MIVAAWIWVVVAIALYLVQFAPLTDQIIRRVLGS
jgi:hypothetical protein